MGLFAAALNDLQKHEGYTIMSVAFPGAKIIWSGRIHHTDKVS